MMTELIQKLQQGRTQETFNDLYDFIAEGSLTQIDNLVLEVAQRSPQIDPVLVVATLRLTFLLREVLPSWPQALKLVEEDFDQRLGSTSALIGLSYEKPS